MVGRRLAVVVTMLVAGESRAVAPLVLTAGFTMKNLTQHAEYLEDAAHALTFKDLMDPDKNYAYKTSTDPASLNFAVTPSTFWIRFTLTNADAADEAFFLEVDYPPLDEIDLVMLDPAGKLLFKQAGDHRPFAQRDVNYANSTFRIDLLRGQTRDIYMRVESTGAVDVPLKLWSKESFYPTQSRILLISGLYLGASMAIIIYNLFLYLTTRERLYLIYVGFQLGMTAAMASIQGYVFQFVWPANPVVNAHSIYVFIFLTGAFSQFYASSFLNLKEKMPRVNRILLVWAWANVGQMLLSFVLSARAMSPYTFVVAICVPVPLIAIGYIQLFRGDRSARFYCLAWTSLLLGVFVFGLARLGFDFLHWTPALSMQLGSTAEAILLSIGIGDQFNEIKKQKYLYLKKIKDQELEQRETELKSASQLREMAIINAESEKNKTLLRVISHDIANPLAVIINYADINAKGKITKADPLTMWKRVLTAARHQEAIILHVRELQSVQSGKTEVPLAPVRIYEAVDQIEFMFQHRLDERKLNLDITRGAADLEVLADGRSLSYNVLNNLVSNAIKFSPEGSTIFVSVHDRGEDVVLEVRDQGIGMNARLVAKLFDNTKPTSRPGLGGEKGTGFGMPIVKTYVERYGGRVEVESRSIEDDKEHHGTTVRLYLKKFQREAA